MNYELILDRVTRSMSCRWGHVAGCSHCRDRVLRQLATPELSWWLEAEVWYAADLAADAPPGVLSDLIQDLLSYYGR